MWRDKVDSTNNVCRREIEALDNLSYIAAKCQSAGRGQGDHTWTSTPGENLTFSYILKPDGTLRAADAIVITHITTLSIVSYLESKGVKAAIKWPNDIWVDGKKICGILIENCLDGPQVLWSIIGVGLNINQTDFPKDLPNPTSLSILTGGQYDVEEELELLMKEICRYEALSKTQSGREIMNMEFEKLVFRLPSNP